MYTVNEIKSNPVIGKDYQAGKLVCLGYIGESSNGNPSFLFAQSVERDMSNVNFQTKLTLKAQGRDRTHKSCIQTFGCFMDGEFKQELKDAFMQQFENPCVVEGQNICVSQSVGFPENFNGYLTNYQVVYNPTTNRVSAFGDENGVYPIVELVEIREEQEIVRVTPNTTITPQEAFNVLSTNQHIDNDQTIKRLRTICQYTTSEEEAEALLAKANSEEGTF